MSTFPEEFKALEEENEKLQKQSDLLTLGLLQEKNKNKELKQTLQTLRNWLKTIDRNHGKMVLIDEALKE